MKKNIADNIPIEDTTPAITHSAKLLVITDGIGASLGGDVPPKVSVVNEHTHHIPVYITLPL